MGSSPSPLSLLFTTIFGSVCLPVCFSVFLVVWLGKLWRGILASAFTALTLLVGHHEEHPACKKMSNEMLVWLSTWTHTHTHNCFTALFPGPPGWAGARRELLDFMVRGKINRGRHTDHPAGRHSIRTNHCPPPPMGGDHVRVTESGPPTFCQCGGTFACGSPLF